jgi:hypothetical protein
MGTDRPYLLGGTGAVALGCVLPRFLPRPLARDGAADGGHPPAGPGWAPLES